MRKSGSRTSSILFFLATLPMLAGCNSLQVHLGRKLYLARTPVTAMSASLSRAPGIAPGERSPLIVTFTQPGGTLLTTEGKGKGKVLWADLVVTPTLVTANKHGVLRLAGDPRQSDGRTAHVVVTVPTHPDLKAELDVPVRYDYAFRASFDGPSGLNGTDGINGTDGAAGLSGSLDPNSPSPGGNGGDGTSGTAGDDGHPGGDASGVQVLVTLRAGPHPLLQVGVTGGGKQEFYLVDPQGGSLSLSALGGRGGSGGRGGHGGRGGSGGIGSPNGSNGNSGSNGLDGNPGTDGSPGLIAIVCDPAAQPYLAVIHTSPTATVTEAPVAPLW